MTAAVIREIWAELRKLEDTCKDFVFKLPDNALSGRPPYDEFAEGGAARVYHHFKSSIVGRPCKLRT